MIRTHTRRDSPLNGTEREGGREGGREGKFFSIITCTNGTERNGKPKKNGTEREGGRD